ncbi:protein TIC 62, chloroplastic [Benincasa hispida]|uniref:protein TIC 62, chloroplastic n=1 Tax=Benincasa hispida TaxID=102211 RepID=UPI0019004C8D|nr:protein TIC 62, chloroplastic [Benincasa hispida]
MECTCSSLRSPALTTVPSSLSRTGFSEKPLLHLKLSNKKSYPLAGRLKFLHIRAQASSSTSNFSSEAGPAISKKEDSKDEDLVFVAGATGRVGSRTVRELLKLGFRVRAGVRNSQKAETLVENVKRIKLDEAVEKLETVVCDLEKPNQIGSAIGNASIVICCIGASEKEIFDITGPYRIDYLATKNLVEAATVAKVKHFVLLTSLGTNKIGFPAAILNLFWGVLLWKRKAEEALIASGLPYTIVRPGGMERPTDTFKETHNTTLSPEDTLFGGLVSNLQVAELMACIAKNPGLSYYKVLEVVAETTAPLTPLEDLLKKIPSKVANAFPEEYGAARTVDPSSKKPSIAKEKESAEANVTEQPPSQIVSSEQLSIAKEKESAVASVTKQSSSPYIAYEDLKPPTSPTPVAPVGKIDLNVVDGVSSSGQTSPVEASTEIAEANVAPAPAPEKAVTLKPLSPYLAYEDLKPPTSPTPDAPVGKIDLNVVDGVSSSAQISSVEALTEIAEANATPAPAPEKAVTLKPLSPYVAYEDLKPPTSPSPSAPSLSFSSTSPSNGPPQPATSAANSTLQIPEAEDSKSDSHLPKPKKQQPLSPFTMYEDLKPPASPTPSL